MGEVVEHAMLHIRKLLFCSVGGQEASFMPCKVSHCFLYCFQFVCVFHCFVVNATPLKKCLCLKSG